MPRECGLDNLRGGHGVASRGTYLYSETQRACTEWRVAAAWAIPVGIAPACVHCSPHCSQTTSAERSTVSRSIPEDGCGFVETSEPLSPRRSTRGRGLRATFVVNVPTPSLA